MRLWLPGLLILLLAVTMAMPWQGGASMGAAAEMTAAPPAHDCCAAMQDAAHGDCTACAFIAQAEPAPATARLPRAIRYGAMSRDLRSTALRLPLPPPRRAAI